MSQKRNYDILARVPAVIGPAIYQDVPPRRGGNQYGVPLPDVDGGKAPGGPDHVTVIACKIKTRKEKKAQGEKDGAKPVFADAGKQGKRKTHQQQHKGRVGPYGHRCRRGIGKQVGQEACGPEQDRCRAAKDARHKIDGRKQRKEPGLHSPRNQGDDDNVPEPGQGREGLEMINQERCRRQGGTQRHVGGFDDKTLELGPKLVFREAFG